VVNLIDVFLVIIAALLLAVAQSPANPFSAEQVTVIKNPGKENMEIIVKDGQKIEHYQASGEIGEGQGAKAGVAYKLKDGSMVYVPEPARRPRPLRNPPPRATAPRYSRPGHMAMARTVQGPSHHFSGGLVMNTARAPRRIHRRPRLASHRLRRQ